MECDYLNGWIKKTVTYAKFSPKMVNLRDLPGNTEEEEEEEEEEKEEEEGEEEQEEGEEEEEERNYNTSQC